MAGEEKCHLKTLQHLSQAVQDSVSSYIRASVSGDKAAAAAAKENAIDGVARTANISPYEARARIDRTEVDARRTFEAARAKATEAAEAARSGVATAAILGFVALLLGAAAAWFGAAAGGRRHDAAAIMVDKRS